MRMALGVLLALTVITGRVAQAQEVPGCGNLHNAYGPFDYRDPVAKRDKLPIVDNIHFTAEVESLEAGATGNLIQDLDYTLRAFPNHHRALDAVARYALRGGRQWANKYVTSAECYFQRAIAFASTDETVYAIYGNYLARSGNDKGAIAQYEQALQLAPDSIDIHYNAGLLYLKMGDLESAKRHAAIAYAGGYPLPGLKDRIEEEERRLASAPDKSAKGNEQRPK